MAAVTGLLIVKAFTYRDVGGEEFSSKYWFRSPPPGDDPSWMVLINDVLTAEKSIYDTTVTFQRAYGYDSNDEHAVHRFVHDWTIPGPPPTGAFAPGTGLHAGAGDQAALVFWPTTLLNTRGKRIYLRKYIHQPYLQQPDKDKLDTVTYMPALQNYANTLSVTYGGLRSAQHDLSTIDQKVSPWVTTRTLKHRGKRGGPT